MPLYDSGDFSRRVAALFPQSWVSQQALVTNSSPLTNGVFGSFCQSTGVGLSYVYNLLVYAKLQMRLATATDKNLDQASLDFFSFGGLPRAAGESDASFSNRIRQQLTLPQPTLAGIQSVVTLYLQAFTVQNLATQVLGLDVSGALDVAGSLDGFASAIPNIPQVNVFDQQSNPYLSSQINLVPPQFCIDFMYVGYLTTDGFFLGRSHIDPLVYSKRETHVISTRLTVVPPLSSGLDALVNQIKAAGCQPIYANNIR